MYSGHLFPKSLDGYRQLKTKNSFCKATADLWSVSWAVVITTAGGRGTINIGAYLNKSNGPSANEASLNITMLIN